MYRYQNMLDLRKELETIGVRMNYANFQVVH